MFTIDDNLPNEEHFLSTSAIDRVASMCSDDPSDIASEARSISEYYIGQNTKQGISDIHKRSLAERKERGFILHLEGGSRELQVIDITGDADRSKQHINMTQALENLPSHVVPIVEGHTHLVNRFNTGPDQYNLKWNDLAPVFQNTYTGRYGGYPAIVASSGYLNVFTTAQKIVPEPFGVHPYYHYEYIGSPSRERGAGRHSPLIRY